MIGFSVSEIGAVLGRSADGVRKMERDGRLPHAARDPLSGRRVWRLAEVERILNMNGQEAIDDPSRS